MLGALAIKAMERLRKRDVPIGAPHADQQLLPVVVDLLHADEATRPTAHGLEGVAFRDLLDLGFGKGRLGARPLPLIGWELQLGGHQAAAPSVKTVRSRTNAIFSSPSRLIVE